MCGNTDLKTESNEHGRIAENKVLLNEEIEAQKLNVESQS